MTYPGPDFTPQQHRVIDLIAEGVTITVAASTFGIHRNTIRNWRRTIPGFATELDFAIGEQSLYWHEQAVALAPKAIAILCTIMHNDASSDSLKLRAATLILKMATEPKAISMHNPAQSPVLQAAPAPAQPVRKLPEPARNSACPCNSGLKYKRCCANRSSPQLGSFRNPQFTGAPVKMEVLTSTCG